MKSTIGSLTALMMLLGVDLAQGEVFLGLGDLSGGGVYSRALAVSADGTVVVGEGRSAFGASAFRWTGDGGMIELPMFYAAVPQRAYGVSPDGTVVVGSGSPWATGTPEPFRWTAAEGSRGLPTLPGGAAWGNAYGASADGSVIVGSSTRAIFMSDTEAFRWTGEGALAGLGDFSGGTFSSAAMDVSDDGTVVVGWGTSDSGMEAFRWTSDNGMVSLGELPGGSFFSRADAVSADGAVVVGGSSSDAGYEAFRWTDGGGMLPLGDLPGGSFFSRALGVSGDGTIVVGFATSAAGLEAFIWDEDEGIRSLKDVLTDDFGADLAGWTLTKAHGISADGRTIVGEGRNPSGITEAWITTIPEPSSMVLLASLFTFYIIVRASGLRARHDGLSDCGRPTPPTNN